MCSFHFIPVAIWVIVRYVSARHNIIAKVRHRKGLDKRSVSSHPDPYLSSNVGTHFLQRVQFPLTPALHTAQGNLTTISTCPALTL